MLRFRNHCLWMKITTIISLNCISDSTFTHVSSSESSIALHFPNLIWFSLVFFDEIRLKFWISLLKIHFGQNLSLSHSFCVPQPQLTFTCAALALPWGGCCDNVNLLVVWRVLGWQGRGSLVEFMLVSWSTKVTILLAIKVSYVF